jgi:hypothetical protein
MADVATALINKEGDHLNAQNLVCLDLSWRRPHGFLLLLSVCLCLRSEDIHLSMRQSRTT